MKKIIIALSLLATLLTGSNAFAAESDESKSLNLSKDYSVRIIQDNDGNFKEEALFLPLRKTCEFFNYNVVWDSQHNRAIVTQGIALKPIISNGEEVNSLIIAPDSSFVELVNEKRAWLEPSPDGLPKGHEAILATYNDRLYVHSSILEKYLGIKTENESKTE